MGGFIKAIFRSMNGSVTSVWVEELVTSEKLENGSIESFLKPS